MTFLPEIEKILKEHNCQVKGSIKDLLLDNFSHYSSVNEKSIIWLGKKFVEKNNIQVLTPIHCLVTDFSELQDKINAKIIILTGNPQLVYTLLYNVSAKQTKGFIHPSAVIHPEAVIHPTVYVGPLTYVGKATIGEGTFIAGSVFIKDKVSIGKNCRIDAGAVIGVEGTGHLKLEDGSWLQFPQIGGTIIEDNVEIGANTYITRGALGNTHIKKGAIVGLACAIGHNVVLEENVFITAKALIGGSSLIKKNTFVAMQAVIRDGMVIGENAMIGMAAVVIKNVPDGETWIGNPARKLK